MPGSLGRELTAEEKRLKVLLKTVVGRRGKSHGAGETVREMAARRAKSFCAAAISLLETETEAEARRWLCGQLLECPEFLVQLIDPNLLTRAQLLKVCGNLMAIDNMLDVRLARLTPGRDADGCPLDRDTVVRILDTLNEISAGGRLILLLNHLTRHADPRIASKATLLIGRRIRNRNWVARQLENNDGRIRANVVEGLWNNRSPDAMHSLWTSLKDKNNRVVGNALIGLHQLGEAGVAEFVKRMIEDPRPPFRWTAAWVMGKMGGEEFIEFLERARSDKDPQVRRSADRALHIIQHASVQDPGIVPKDDAPIGSVTPIVPEKKPAEDDTFALKLDGKYITRVSPSPKG